MTTAGGAPSSGAVAQGAGSAAWMKDGMRFSLEKKVTVLLNQVAGHVGRLCSRAQQLKDSSAPGGAGSAPPGGGGGPVPPQQQGQDTLANLAAVWEEVESYCDHVHSACYSYKMLLHTSSSRLALSKGASAAPSSTATGPHADLMDSSTCDAPGSLQKAIDDLRELIAPFLSSPPVATGADQAEAPQQSPPAAETTPVV